MTSRADIEWLVEHENKKAGCLRIGDDVFNSAAFDDFDRSCTVVCENGVIEIKGWAAPRKKNVILLFLNRLGLCVADSAGITPSQWEAMEKSFLRNGITRYKFSRARGVRGQRNLYWHHRRWDGKKWIKDTD